MKFFVFIVFLFTVSTHAIAASLAALAAPDSGGVQRRLKLLTPKIPCAADVPDHCALADPAAPAADGNGVRITGTGFGYARWNSWDDLLSGATYAWVPFQLYQNVNGNLNQLNNPVETVWDISIENWAGDILYGGSVTPTQGRDHAVMWDDNFDRRVYAFVKDDQGRWVRQPVPITGDSDTLTWLGHSYGHQFIEESSTHKMYVFYERVDRLQSSGVPATTEIFAREMISPVMTGLTEYPILSVGTPPFPATDQQNGWGSQLIEGPRPVAVTISGQTFYIIGFSSGNFMKPTYGINVAWSTNLLGPYHIFLNADGRDFQDFGANIRQAYQFSWGPGRPSFFQDPNGRWWVLFHAVDDPTSQFRKIYLAPVQFALDARGNPSVVVSDNNPGGAAPLWSSGVVWPAAGGVFNQNWPRRRIGPRLPRQLR